MTEGTPLLGTTARPLRVAIVGTGPSGFYAAEALLKRTDGLVVQVDMFDRLPTPYGLVRGGVAPDHQKIKAVIAVYEKIASLPTFRFFGNVKLGQDIQVEDLQRHYDQVVYAVGNETDRRMGIPGEDLEGSFAATAFVGWYNGHPDHRHHRFDLSVERVAVVGVGNVAMDVTRVLAKDPSALASTDISDYALEALRASKVREIVLLGRRGVAQAAFSPAEIMEIAELPSSDLVLDPRDVELDELSKAALKEPNDKKNVEFLTEHAKKGEAGRPRKVRLRFLVSPVEVLGEGGRVKAVKLERNTLVPDEKGNPKAKGTGRFEVLPVGMVLRSVGYYGVPVPGMPFDPKIGRVPNEGGRVLDPATRKVRGGEYVVGWSKRGPTGLIGTNRADSVATVKAMVEDAQGKPAPPSPERTPEAVLGLLKSKGTRFVSFQDWKRLDQIELSRGKAKGKIREKFVAVEDMMKSLDGR